MSNEIRLAVVGVGNCTSALIQGLKYYAEKGGSSGLMHEEIAGYHVTDICPVAAFDVDAKKVGLDLSEAILAQPNNAYRVPDLDLAYMGVSVLMGPIEDGVPDHLSKYVDVAKNKPVNLVKALRDSGAEVMVNMLPTGSAAASRIYAQAAIEAGVAFVNGMPELIVCDKSFAEDAVKACVPLIGDDIKSQLGGTILHRAMVETMLARGIRIKKTYQVNYAGNTDFDNLVHRGRSKEKTKREAVETLIPYDADVAAGFAHISNMGDRKTARFYFELENFGGAPLLLDAKLEVEDSANFCGVIVDAIRCCRLAQDRGVSGVLTSASAYFCKHPPEQIRDHDAYQRLQEFLAGDIER